MGSDANAVVFVKGEVDAATAPAIRAEIELAVAPATSTLTIDMTDVTFMDSAGLGCLALAHRLMVDQGGTVVVRNPNTVVMQVMSIVGMDQVLQVESTQ